MVISGMLLHTNIRNPYPPEYKRNSSIFIINFHSIINNNKKINDAKYFLQRAAMQQQKNVDDDCKRQANYV